MDNAPADSTATGPPDGPSARALARLRAVMGLATLIMLGLSWPLWVEGREIPRVPFVAGLPEAPSAISGFIFGSVVVAVLIGAVGLGGRWVWAGAVVLLAGLVAQDQHRFQPWVYQFGLTGLALATRSRSGALGCARLFLVALYFHSGLSKLDVSFTHGMGALFLRTAAHGFGLDPSRWPSSLRWGLILAMPVWELAVAMGLCFQRTRRVALGGAIILHLTLIAILGPGGLQHSGIVLLWNAALIIEDVVLFWPEPVPVIESSSDETPLAPLTRWVFAMMALLPFGERWGLWDSWPSFALYASHTERTEVFAHRDDLAAWPTSARHALHAAEGPWLRLDLTAWSRLVRGVPVYPQARACLGLAEALAARTEGGRSPRVVVWGRADRWTGRRERWEGSGLAAIRRLGDRYRLNAHPARGGALERTVPR
jgi:hypothetical protein